ncbi:MAG: hypothetical protein JWQ49_1154 [Edaphobacter sp.]|nr:hypothetical protein [Edaphobacter sp.]
MKTFTIENGTNNIILHGTAAEAETVAEAERFSTAEEFGELAGTWPASRLIEIWNGLPGVAPVKKFTDRKSAVTRIWKAIQSLNESPASEPTPEPEAQPEAASEIVTPFDEPQAETPAAELVAAVGAQAPDVAPEPTPATKKATRQKKAPTGEPKAKATREGSKTATILELLKREGGVSLKGIMEATGWQAHSVRGFVSGTLGKKMGLTVVSTKGADGERTYTLGS